MSCGQAQSIFGAGKIRWRNRVSGGCNCLLSIELGGTRRQAQGLPLRGFDRDGGTWVGETLSTGHLLRISTPGRRGMLLAGGVAGAEPPHKGGPNRPDRTTAVVSG